MESNCDFCKEINHDSDSLFHRIYGNQISDRIVSENESCICIPTIGQLVPGSLLILPKHHCYTISSLHDQQKQDFLNLLSQVRDLYPFSIVFEHGCFPKAGHNCGVYHAHCHVVPVQSDIEVASLLHTGYQARHNLDQTLEILKEEKEYALFIDHNHQVYHTLPNSSNAPVFKSQHFRRWLSTHFSPDKNYDWKAYQEPEEDLLQTLDLLVGLPVH